MCPYSLDLRERVAAVVDDDEESIRETARIFRVSTSFIVRLFQRRRATGTLEPKPHGGGRTPALGPSDRERLAQLIQEQPDATLKQLKQRGGFTCSLKTLWYALKRQGLTLKKKSLHASERDRPDVQKKRRSFRRQVSQIDPKRLVFVDETGVTTAMTPTRAWAPRGERAVASAPASWETVTVLAAFKATGASVLPLPPYSPDYTPIEEMFSKVKEALRRFGARVEGQLYDVLGEALRQVTLEDILGWFRHAGLCATPG